MRSHFLIFSLVVLSYLNLAYITTLTPVGLYKPCEFSPHIVFTFPLHLFSTLCRDFPLLTDFIFCSYISDCTICVYMEKFPPIRYSS